MNVISIEGHAQLSGTVRVEGAKNSALKLMAASILAPGTTILKNVPNISDVHLMGKVLKHLGAQIEVLGTHELSIDCSGVASWETPYELVVKMRASTAVLGPLLARFGKAVVAMPGGCKIGARKIDLHILGLEALGVKFSVEHGYIHASAPEGLKGAEINLDFASVGATENLIMASVHAQGITTIKNAAREPEIVDLARFLNKMGAKISGAGSPTVQIEGVEKLKPVEHEVVGDRIEAGTFIVAGALCAQDLLVEGFNPVHLGLVLKKLMAMGIQFEQKDRAIRIKKAAAILPTDIQTLPYPGFPTDMQAQLMCLLALAQGRSVVTENIFENRFMFANELLRMGANIQIENRRAVVVGVDKLQGAQVQASDLRAGAALALAGLVAEGTTTISGVHHIDRGYENFVEKLCSLGASAQRLELPDEDEQN